MSLHSFYIPHKRVALSFLDEDGNTIPSPTEQHHKDECDIEKILRNYDKHGLVTHLNTAIAHYGDFTEVNEYQSSLNLINDAQRAFSELPAQIRLQFNNDAGLFMEYCTNPKNTDRLIELGLMEKPAEKLTKKATPKEEDTPPKKEPSDSSKTP